MRSLRRLRLALDHDVTLGTLLDRLADVHGDRVLVDESGGATRTYREAAALVAAWAGAVEGGQGDRVVVAFPNGYDQLLACLAVARAGLVPVPVNDRMSPDEIEHVVTDAGAVSVVRSPDDLAGGAPVEPTATDAASVAAIFYTSGTTGRPKGAELTHRALLHAAARTALWPAGVRRDEAVLALPTAHIMGFALLLAFAGAGVPVHVLPQFDAGAVLDAIERRRSTVFAGVPAMYRMLLDAGAEQRDLRSVRLWVSGADAMPPDLARRFQRMGASATMPGLGISVGEAMFAEGWGMVETAGLAIGRLRLPYVGLPAVPMPGYRLRVGDDGELLVKGPGVLAGYHGDEGATASAVEDGWLHTGDKVRRGPFGGITFDGRLKDVVKSGGYSVFAAEVERALEEHPAVAEAGVVGMPDDRLGERVVAAVRLRGPAEPDELRAFATERLAGYKVPRAVVVLGEELPRGGTGKLQKDRLKMLISGALGADGRGRKGGS